MIDQSQYIRSYVTARIEQLKAAGRVGRNVSAISELHAVVKLCDGLIAQAEIFNRALDFVATCPNDEYKTEDIL